MKSLSRARVQSAEKKPDSNLLTLIDFISSYRELEGEKLFFKNLDEFFSRCWKGSVFIVYSLLKEKDSDQSLNRRLLWNRDKLKEFHPNVLDGKKSADSLDGYYILSLGEEKQQQIFGVLKTDAEIEGIFWKYLNNFLIAQQKRVKEVKKLNKKFEYLTDIDAATGLYNQQKLFQDVKGLVEDYQKHGEGFAILFIDIDHFKLVNEKYGHLVGSETLADLARLLKKILRDNDLIYRYGGDEFVTIVKGVTPKYVHNVAERVLQGVRKNPFHTKKRSFNGKDSVFHIGVSIGVSLWPQDMKGGQDILILADKRMYHAKDSGRDCICGPEL